MFLPNLFKSDDICPQSVAWSMNSQQICVKVRLIIFWLKLHCTRAMHGISMDDKMLFSTKQHRMTPHIGTMIHCARYEWPVKVNNAIISLSCQLRISNYVISDVQIQLCDSCQMLQCKEMNTFIICRNKCSDYYNIDAVCTVWASLKATIRTRKCRQSSTCRPTPAAAHSCSSTRH